MAPDIENSEYQKARDYAHEVNDRWGELSREKRQMYQNNASPAELRAIQAKIDETAAEFEIAITRFSRLHEARKGRKLQPKLPGMS